MIRIRKFLAMAALATLCFTSSCAWSIGSDKQSKTYRHPTIAEELRDLEKARDDELISEEEYQKVRQCLLEGSKKN